MPIGSMGGKCELVHWSAALLLALDLARVGTSLRRPD